MLALVDTIRRIVDETLSALQPALVMMATVDSAEPLRLMVDNRFFLERAALIIPDIYLAGAEPSDHVHGIPAHKTRFAEYRDPEENELEFPKHLHAIPEHETERVAYAGLKVGDKVVLLRNHGGQQFVVLGRLM